MEIIINKLKLLQLISTCISGVITVLIPIISYILFKSSLTEDIEMGGFESSYDSLIIWIIIVGIMITGSTYFIFEFPANSIKRGSLSLINSVLDVIFIYLFSYMSLIKMKYTCQKNCRKEITLNLTGVYLLLIIIMLLYVIKNVYDLIDYKVNTKYYTRSSKKRAYMKSNLIKCPNCDYMCQPEWKKCPICKSHLQMKH